MSEKLLDEIINESMSKLLGSSTPHISPEVQKTEDERRTTIKEDEALDRVLYDLQNYPTRHKPPEARLKKNDLEISVNHEFNQDRLKIEGKRHGIIIKLIAKYEEWIDLELKYLADQINAADAFDVIEHFISDKNPKSSRVKLKAYAANYPEAFALDVYECANYANFINPSDKKYRRHDLPNWFEAKKAACELYYWILANYQNSPDAVKRVFKKYNFNAVVQLSSLKHATRHIIKIEFELDDISKDRFYHTFIYNSLLSSQRLKNSKRIRTGDIPFLKKVLS
jgi:hypothetical protein